MRHYRFSEIRRAGRTHSAAQRLCGAALRSFRPASGSAMRAGIASAVFAAVLSIAVSAVLLVGSANAQTGAKTATGTASATILKPLSCKITCCPDFGKWSCTDGHWQNNYVEVCDDYQGGTCKHSDDLNKDNHHQPTNGCIHVSGEPNCSFTISCNVTTPPKHGDLSLECPGSGSLDKTGNCDVYFGGKWTFGDSRHADDDNATICTTVDYF